MNFNSVKEKSERFYEKVVNFNSSQIQNQYDGKRIVTTALLKSWHSQFEFVISQSLYFDTISPINKLKPHNYPSYDNSLVAYRETIFIIGP